MDLMICKKTYKDRILEADNSKGAAYYDANRDVFASCLSAELNVGVPANFQSKQRLGKPDSKKVWFTLLLKKKRSSRRNS